MIRRAAAVLVLSLTLAAPSLAATTEPGATWPCVQRKVVELSLNSIWQRGDLPDSARQLANDPAVQALAEKARGAAHDDGGGRCRHQGLCQKRPAPIATA